MSTIIDVPMLPEKATHAHRRAVRKPRGRGTSFATGLTAGILLGRAISRSSQHDMPHLRTFQRGLAANYGEAAAATLAARIQACYDQYYATRPRFAQPALRWHLTQQILPGLALYTVLRDNEVKQALTPGTALKETGALIERLDILARWLPLLRYVPFAFPLFRLFGRLAMLLYPKQGWDIQMVEQSPNRVAFNISRCFYLDVLTAYGAPELTAHFCYLDDVAYAALPPSIKWERTTTLARGGPYCDFCWRANATSASHPNEKAVNDPESASCLAAEVHSR